ncbi:hypothetical protein CARUB_v10024698mg [Capsella rubella]|uniref:F-box domain-containing protein n=1 Tax=Capsella rubella TaxID=81985 RepID=R0HWR2_9BRAS|nr:hypothetical protein CARUB_v10024698mg [Capsella rubella]
MSDLPRDLVEEVLSRVPLTSLRPAKATCKRWNKLFKHRRFTKKHILNSRTAENKKREFMAIMIIDSSVYLMSVGLHYKDDINMESSIERKGKLSSVNDSNRVDIISVFHCNGLLLCHTKEETPRLVVWNPYRGETRWIETSDRHHYNSGIKYRTMFALGYKNSHRRSHKILRYSEINLKYIKYRNTGESKSVEIYNFNSDSWKDITRTANKRFGPQLSLPFRSSSIDNVSLSSVREDQIAVLFQRKDTLRIELWITSKIEPEAVSWSNLFLAVDVEKTLLTYDRFFVDEEKKVFMVFAEDKETQTNKVVAYIIGEVNTLTKEVVHL